MDDFRALLREFLAARQWKVKTLSRATGIAEGVIYRWLSEDGSKKPSEDNLAKLAPVIGRSHAELMVLVGRLTVVGATPASPPADPEQAEWNALFNIAQPEERPKILDFTRRYLGVVPPADGQPPRNPTGKAGRRQVDKPDDRDLGRTKVHDRREVARMRTSVLAAKALWGIAPSQRRTG